MKKKKGQKKAKKITIALSSRDYEKLTRYAKQKNISRPLAAKRLLRSQLALLTMEKVTKQPKNQLGLFDSLQIDIFDKVSKVSE